MLSPNKFLKDFQCLGILLFKNCVPIRAGFQEPEAHFGATEIGFWTSVDVDNFVIIGKNFIIRIVKSHWVQQSLHYFVYPEWDK